METNTTSLCRYVDYRSYHLLNSRKMIKLYETLSIHNTKENVVELW